jgi:hypothetical protein
MKKSEKLACHVVDSKMVIDSLPSVQLSPGIFALLEKIYDGNRFLWTSLISGRMFNTVCYNTLYYVSTVSQPWETIYFANNRKRVP